MSELVERVARAVLSELEGRKGFRQTIDEIDDEMLWEVGEAIGRAAIAAIEPELQILLGALADIGGSDDMDEQARRNKANRIYAEMSAAFDEALK